MIPYHGKGSPQVSAQLGRLLRLSCAGILSSWCSLRYIAVVLCSPVHPHRDEARARLRTQVSLSCCAWADAVAHAPEALIKRRDRGEHTSLPSRRSHLIYLLIHCSVRPANSGSRSSR